MAELMRRADKEAYLNNTALRQQVKKLMEERWNRKGVAKATVKCKWPMPGYKQADLLKDEDKR